MTTGGVYRCKDGKECGAAYIRKVQERQVSLGRWLGGDLSEDEAKKLLEDVGLGPEYMKYATAHLKHVK